jgi:7-cyano-7-deazaguanine synthase
MSQRAVILLSGGLDSVTLATLLASLSTQPAARSLRTQFDLAPEGYELHLLSVQYGQRHAKELRYAQAAATRLEGTLHAIDLSTLSSVLKGSALTDAIDVPEGHYAASNMATTVVANRNAILLTVAYALAVSANASVVATAVHSGDHAIYPDCRPAFITSFAAMEHLATEGFASPDLRLVAPFVNIPKTEIVRIGHTLGIDYSQTWSCYKGGILHCGKCGTCVERKEAFAYASVPDPTIYADPFYSPDPVRRSA